MKVAHATLKELRQSPQKVRLVVDMIRGKRVDDALVMLAHTTKKATTPVQKLIQSAVANAKEQHNTAQSSLVISKIAVDEGKVLKRREYRARGNSNILKLRNSHIMVELSEVAEDVKILSKKDKKKAKKNKSGTTTSVASAQTEKEEAKENKTDKKNPAKATVS